jgi:hypothetical protein
MLARRVDHSDIIIPQRGVCPSPSFSGYGKVILLAEAPWKSQLNGPAEKSYNNSWFGDLTSRVSIAQ